MPLARSSAILQGRAEFMSQGTCGFRVNRCNHGWCEGAGRISQNGPCSRGGAPKIFSPEFWAKKSPIAGTYGNWASTLVPRKQPPQGSLAATGTTVESAREGQLEQRPAVPTPQLLHNPQCSRWASPMGVRQLDSRKAIKPCRATRAVAARPGPLGAATGTGLADPAPRRAHCATGRPPMQTLTVTNCKRQRNTLSPYGAIIGDNRKSPAPPTPPPTSYGGIINQAINPDQPKVHTKNDSSCTHSTPGSHSIVTPSPNQYTMRKMASVQMRNNKLRSYRAAIQRRALISRAPAPL